MGKGTHICGAPTVYLLCVEHLLCASSPHGLVFQSHPYMSVSVIRLQICYSQRMGLFMFLCLPVLAFRRCSEIDYQVTA